jgi:ABC-type transport system involved in multi-copper enzyme maturation permease subunit
LRWSATLLVLASWISAAIFGAYIILFFGGMAARGTTERWNEALPVLYDRNLPLAALAIGSRFITGGVLLLLGPIQLIGVIRRSTPAPHRWLGRIYVLSAGLAGLGGLGFITSKGTIGGPLMNVGFGLYGALMVLAAALAYAHARAGRYEMHRAWTIRLYALTVAWNMASGS